MYKFCAMFILFLACYFFTYYIFNSVLDAAERDIMVMEIRQFEVMAQVRYGIPAKVIDTELTERVVAAEARGTDQQAMIAVCNVIQNRTKLRNMSIEQVLTEPAQFASPYTGKISDEVSGAVNKALLHGAKIVPDDTEYFHAHYVHPEWAGRFTEVYRDDWHVFYADRREK